MIKYAILQDELTGLCSVAIGDDEQEYIEMGMSKMNVELSDVDNNWYLAEKCPMKTPEQKEQEEQAQFDKEFFKTSLGYVRRKVSMQTGEVKDFLADILPVLEIGVPIIFYDRDLNQSKKMVTEVFLAECKEQILKDFWGE
jgi:hypothetical protein